MPQKIILTGPSYSFDCYGAQEAKQLGFLDCGGMPGRYEMVAGPYSSKEGLLLKNTLESIPDAVLILTGRRAVSIFRQRDKVNFVQPEE